MGQKALYKNNIDVFLKEISAEWLYINKNTFKKSTCQTYSYLIDKYIINSNISEIPVYQIETKDIVIFSENLLSQNLSPKTINNILLVLNYLLKFSNHAYGTTLIKIPFVKDSKKEMKVLSIIEQKQLEQYIRQDMDIYKFAILIALYTGIRIGELCALRWEDISDSTITINKSMNRLKTENGKSEIIIDSPKTNSSNRIIPYPQFLNPIIENQRKDRQSFVLSTNKLDFIEPRLLQMKFNNIIRECSLEHVTFHTLRHTFATRCIECGFDVKTLSEILGHSDVKTTLNRYVHSSMELKQINMNKLSEISI